VKAGTRACWEFVRQHALGLSPLLAEVLEGRERAAVQQHTAGPHDSTTTAGSSHQEAHLAAPDAAPARPMSPLPAAGQPTPSKQGRAVGNTAPTRNVVGSRDVDRPAGAGASERHRGDRGGCTPADAHHEQPATPLHGTAKQQDGRRR